MKKYWFKPKKFGYGFVPISWEGWLATLGFIIVIFILAYINKIFAKDIATKDGFRFLFDLAVLCVLFTLICKRKLDGKLKWRWGRDDDV